MTSILLIHFLISKYINICTNLSSVNKNFYHLHLFVFQDKGRIYDNPNDVKLKNPFKDSIYGDIGDYVPQRQRNDKKYGQSDSNKLHKGGSYFDKSKDKHRDEEPGLLIVNSCLKLVVE